MPSELRGMSSLHDDIRICFSFNMKSDAKRLRQSKCVPSPAVAFTCVACQVAEVRMPGTITVDIATTALSESRA